jgi:hypothetical protein
MKRGRAAPPELATAVVSFDGTAVLIDTNSGEVLHIPDTN